MQREILKPAYDTPLIVKLDFGPEGVERDGKFGMQYMYTLNDDAGCMFVDPPARQAILASGAEAGDTIQLVKTKRGKDTVYSAAIVGDAAEAPAPPPSTRERIAPRTGTAASRLPQRAYHQPQPAERPASAAPEQRPAASRHADAPTAAMTVRAPEPAPGRMTMSDLLRHAVNACAEAQTYAQQRGLEIRFTSEDIRAIALSVYIGAQRNGGNR